MFKVNNKDTRMTPYFIPYSGVFIVNFEQVNANWVVVSNYKVNEKWTFEET